MNKVLSFYKRKDAIYDNNSLNSLLVCDLDYINKIYWLIKYISRLVNIHDIVLRAVVGYIHRVIDQQLVNIKSKIEYSKKRYFDYIVESISNNSDYHYNHYCYQNINNVIYATISQNIYSAAFILCCEKISTIQTSRNIISKSLILKNAKPKSINIKGGDVYD